MFKIINELKRRLTLINANLFRPKSTNGADQLILPSDLHKIESHQYCLNHIKKYDRENYLAALCIKDQLSRRAVVALRAFNVELSLVRDTTTNTDRAKLRFNFWARLIDEIIRRDKGATKWNLDDEKSIAYYRFSPVAKELLDLFHYIDIDEDISASLRDMIGSRLSSKVLGYKSFNTIEELEQYCSKSNSTLYQIAWNMALQLHNTWHTNYGILPNIKSAAESLGVAHGLSNIIRGIPYNASKNCCYIPTELMNRYQLDRRDFVLSGQKKELDSKRLSPVVKDLSMRCQELCKETFQSSRSIPNYFRHLFLPRVSIQMNLKKLKKCQYDICDPILFTRDGLLPLNLWMASKYLRAPII